MSNEKMSKPEIEQYDPNLEAQDEEVASGGNNRLMYILVGIMLLLVGGYIALPKGAVAGITAVTPSFMLDDAAVTGTMPAAEDTLTAGPKEVPVAATETEKPVKKGPDKEHKAMAASPAATAAAAAEAREAQADLQAASAPEPAPAAQTVAPAAAPAPTQVTLSGKIDDENGRPLVGATVLLRGSSKGTSTDANGNYTLEVPGGSNTLVFGYGGYEDEEVRSSGTRPVNVTLTPKAKVRRRK